MRNRMTWKQRAAVAVGVVGALALGGIGDADAKIREVDVECTTRGGNNPPGQPTTCRGNGLIQETENQNPAGHAPPGHN
jgi:hypothetical protein